MRLDQAEGAVVEYCGSLHRSLSCFNTVSEPEAGLGLIAGARIRGVNSVSSSVSSVHGSQRLRSFLSSFLRVGRAKEVAESLDSIIFN